MYANEFISSAWSDDAARFLHEPVTEIGRLQRGAELAVQLVEGCSHSGVTYTTATYVETVAATDQVAVQGDAWQYELSQGPCLDAARHQHTIHSDDLAQDERWPTWGPRAFEQLGIASMLSVLLRSRRRRIGALNLYARRPGSFNDQIDLVETIAVNVALAAEDARQIEHRTHAMTSRTTIGQAQGIIMERFDIDADHAFQILRRYSQIQHRPLRTIADEISQTRTLPQIDLN